VFLKYELNKNHNKRVYIYGEFYVLDRTFVYEVNDAENNSKNRNIINIK